MKMKEKYIATMIGCANGDTLGMPVEDWKREQIKKYVGRITKPIAPVLIKDSNGCLVKADEFGELSYYNKKLEKGDYTDDTIFPLAITRSISARQCVDIDDIAARHLAVYESAVDKNGFGGTTAAAFGNLSKGISPLRSGVVGAPGNAPATKMWPVGLYMNGLDNFHRGLFFAEIIGQMTHLDPRSVAGGVVQAYSVYLLLRNPSRKDFRDSTLGICRMYEKPLRAEFMVKRKETLTSRLEWIAMNPDADDESAFDYLGNGSPVTESYAFALFMFQKYWNKPIEGLLETVNYGGDCDTTGAMYGTLCGARNGMIFPKEWVDMLKGKEELIEAAEVMWRMKK